MVPLLADGGAAGELGMGMAESPSMPHTKATACMGMSTPRSWSPACCCSVALLVDM